MKRLQILGAGLVLLAVAGTIWSDVSSQNPHGKLAWDCQDCHTAESWKKMRQDRQ